MKIKNFRRFMLLFALGIAYGFMYVMPYMSSSFYDQMIEAMGVTNEQLGMLRTYYAIACTISYLPGGWIGDKFNPRPVLLASIFGQARHGYNRRLCLLACGNEGHPHDRHRRGAGTDLRYF